MPRKPTFARLLRELREQQGLTLVALAAAADLHRQTILKLESGENQPTWAVVQALARALDVPTDYFATTQKKGA